MNEKGCHKIVVALLACIEKAKQLLICMDSGKTQQLLLQEKMYGSDEKIRYIEVRPMPSRIGAPLQLSRSETSTFRFCRLHSITTGNTDMLRITFFIFVIHAMSSLAGNINRATGFLCRV